MQDKQGFVQEFERRQRNAPSMPEWLRKFRREALDKFIALPFPTTREEEWRFTNVAPIVKIPFRFPDSRSSKTVPIDFHFGEEIRLVFVNGQFDPQLSSDFDRTIQVEPLRRALTNSSILEEHFGRYVTPEESAFTAMNSAFFEDGALVQIPANLVLQSPIHLFFVSTVQTEAVIHPRVLIETGKGSEATIIESHFSLTNHRYLSNAVTEVVLGEGSVLHHLKIQNESDEGFHIASVHAEQKRDSNYSSFLLTLGAELSRTDLRVRLDGVGTDCTLNGLYLISGNQHTDHHTTIDHIQPHGTSQELYKGILNGNGRAVFNGKIIVRKDAQKTDARQTNKNLLLSDNARINTKPQLEILADDVKCNHGATIGHLEEEALFYLKTRGLGDANARTLLLYGFVHDVSDRIKNEWTRKASVWLQSEAVTQ